MELKRYSASKLAQEGGQSIVEITLITPLLLVALYVPADFGLAYFTAHLTENAVREGARIGTGLKPPFGNAEANQVTTETTDRLPNLLRNSTVTVRFLDNGVANCMEVVEVTATGDYNFFLYQVMRLIGLSAPDQLAITRSVQMRYNFQSNSNNQVCTAT